MRKQIEGSQAIAQTIAVCRPDVICAYPISPQTHIVEGIGGLVKSGKLQNCEFINVESEFAALSVAIGSSAAGARSYTATASQGILFMAEAVYNAAGLGMRGKRFSMLVDNGVVKQLNVEAPGEFKISDADTILGLESGANDYVTKPFRINVLLARLRAHLRQHERSEDAVMTIGPYEFHPAAKMLMEKGGKKKIRLTDKEASILKYLFRAGDRPVARDVLLNEVWGYNAGVTTHTLETHIYRLRQKIEKDPANAAILITDRGGYRLQP